MTDPKSNCNEHLLRCGVLALENPDGLDAGTSGTLTFEKSAMAAALGNLKVSIDGTCSFSKGTKCPAGSCYSQYSY
jgi:chitinase